MDAKDFFELTAKMRAAQKLYYKSRLQGDLVAAKGLESQLDKVLKDGLDIEPIAIDKGAQLKLIMDHDNGK